MIVLGPHVLAHHLLDHEDDDCDKKGNDDHDHDNTNVNSPRTSSISEQHDSADDNNNNASSDDDCHCHGTTDDSSPPPQMGTMVQIDVEEGSMKCWREARLKISIALGSIGIPPLTTNTNRGNHGKDTAVNPNNQIDNESLQSNLDCLTDVANAHVRLLQTIHRAIETLSAGTSVRLGLGSGNGCRPVVRAEKAWLARRRLPQRQRRQRSSRDSAYVPASDGVACHRPKLTMQKSRDILHNVMADQAISLRDMLLEASIIANTEEDCPLSTADDWNEFALDLQHSRDGLSGVVLTLSQLTAWANRLGEFLSFVLSEHLSRPHPPTPLDSHSYDDGGSMMAGAKRSSQVARERTAFLQSAFPSSKAGDDSNRGTAGKKCPRKRRAEKEIESLKATLEAARVSLWAFESSYSNSCEDDADNPDYADDTDITEDVDSSEIWWREFRDLMERCSASVPQFEERFLSTADGEDGEGETAVNTDGTNDLLNADARDRQISEHVSDAVGTNGENSPTDATAQVDSAGPSADKTLVFSGSGAKRPHPPSGKRIATPSSSDRGKPSLPPPSSYRAADQTMLMRDLTKRIETMGMAEEHEVVVNVETGTEDVDREEAMEGGARNASSSTSLNRRDTRKREDKNQPFFLGVSGSLLAELTSTMASRPYCDSISEG